MRMLAAVVFVLGSISTAEAAETVCNVTVNVTDPDPKGLNVRAAPGGKVIATLVDKADWIELHVAGQSGDWYAIDRANQVDNNRMGDDIVMWKGRGYVHKSTVGLSGLQQGTTIYFDHDVKSRAVVMSADGDQATTLLVCWNDFYKVKIEKGVGWTRGVCTNENTTCS